MAGLSLISGPQDLTQMRAVLNDLINRINRIENVLIPQLKLAFQQITVTSGSYTVAAPYFQINVNRSISGPTTITLPDAATWYAAYGDAISILIVDVKGDASSNNITVTPAGSDTIVGQATFAIGGDYAALALRPKKGGGWYV